METYREVNGQFIYMGQLIEEFLINSRFDIWQRGSAFSPAAGANLLTADQWRVDVGSGVTLVINRQAFTLGQTDVPQDPEYYIELDRQVAGTTECVLSQRVFDVTKMTGQTVCFSFYGKISTGTANLNVNIKQNFGLGGSPSSDVDSATQVVALTTSWKLYTLVFELGGLSGKVIGTNFPDDSYTAVRLAWPETEGAVSKIHIADPQFIKGVKRGTVLRESFGQALHRCQEFYWKSFPYTVAPAQAAGGTGALPRRCTHSSSTNTFQLPVYLPRRMYKTGGVVVYNPGASNTNWYNNSRFADSGAGAVYSVDGHDHFSLDHTQISADATGEVCFIHATKECLIGS